MSKSKNFALGALLAAAGGYVAGLLTAPKSGKETRADLKNAAPKSFDEQLQKTHDELNDLLVKTKSEGAKLTGQAREDYDTAVKNAMAAKGKAQEVLAALRSKEARESGDRELKYALDSAGKAVRHLRRFLKK